MITIGCKVDITPFESINRKRGKRILFATAITLRKTGERVQEAIQDRERTVLTVRKESFFFGSKGSPGGVGAKLGPRPDIASGRMYQEIYVGEAGAKAGKLLLAEFEAGGTRKPFAKGAKHVAIPVVGGPVRPTMRSLIPQAYTFQGLKFKGYRFGKKVRRKRRGKTVDETIFTEFGRINAAALKAKSAMQWKGEQRTFIVPDVGVFQRFAPGQDGTRLIWGFAPPFPIDTRLEFVKTAQRVADKWFHEEMERQTVEAIARVR